MLMSKSRLEKFLYALYSLDSNDLPTPLSRIEELYKCLVTGEEVPTFEPLSRVEKYLMTILGVYDADSLPNPLSRVEVLLYKLATGDDNLDDVKSFLSEHEELSAEIIRNGGVGGNIDIEYVLYTLSTEFNTLYNTAEKPVKSAILKGQTLVNYFKPLDDVDIVGSVCGFQDGKIAFQFGDGGSIWGSSYTPGSLRLTNSLKVSPNTKYFAKLILSKPIDGVVQFGNFKESEYSASDIITLKNNNTNIYQAIMTTGIDTDYIGVILYHSVAEIVYGELLVVPYQEGMENWDIPYFEGMQSVKMPVLTTSNEDGTKTNILTVNEPVELRGIGEVKDELDLVTGEVTRRISEIVLDGSDDLAYNREAHSNDTTTMVHVPLPNTNRNFDFYNDKLPQKHIYDITNVTEGVFSDWGGLFVRLLNSKLSSPDSNGVKEYLQSKPITVQYQLATESVKTIDISTVDQDGNNTELSTFNDITHVTLSSEGLIPEAELEVATKNEEVLNTMSLKMDDISAAQTTLKETSNTQSENVDATMIATTEIYEGLL